MNDVVVEVSCVCYVPVVMYCSEWHSVWWGSLSICIYHVLRKPRHISPQHPYIHTTWLYLLLRRQNVVDAAHFVRRHQTSMHCNCTFSRQKALGKTMAGITMQCESERRKPREQGRPSTMWNVTLLWPQSCSSSSSSSYSIEQ